MRFIWALFNTVIFTIIYGLPGMLLTFFESKKGKILSHCARMWGKSILFFSGVKYTVKGLENLKPKGNYVFAGNHASVFDIPIAFSCLPYWLVPVAKIELKSIILLGWIMRSAGHIFIDRKNRDSAIQTLEKAKDSLINHPRSILLFPEGTRTIDGSLGQFKRGGMLLSINTNLPIVPIAFVGTFDLLEKGAWKMKRMAVELRIGHPLNTEKFSYEDRGNVADTLRKKVYELLQN